MFRRAVGVSGFQPESLFDRRTVNFHQRTVLETLNLGGHLAGGKADNTKKLISRRNFSVDLNKGYNFFGEIVRL
jgi:hypothetical protein